jgi:hypothetical protein
MNDDLKQFLNSLNMIEFKQLCVVFYIRYIGNKDDVINEFLDNFNLDLIKTKINEISKYRFIIFCDGSQQNPPHVYYTNKYLSNVFLLDNEYILYTSQRCDACRKNCSQFQYENIFYINRINKERINELVDITHLLRDEINEIRDKKKTEKSCVETCVLL